MVTSSQLHRWAAPPLVLVALLAACSSGGTKEGGPVAALEPSLDCGPIPDGSAIVSVQVTNTGTSPVSLERAELVKSEGLDPVDITAVPAPAGGGTMIGFAPIPPNTPDMLAIWEGRAPVDGFEVPAGQVGFLLVAATTSDKGGYDAVDLTYRAGGAEYQRRLDNSLRIFKSNDEDVCETVTSESP